VVINVAIMAFVGLPATFLLYLTLSMAGRVANLAGYLFLTAFACLTLTVTPSQVMPT